MLLRMSSTPFVVGATVQLHPATVHAGGPPVTAALDTAIVSSAGAVLFEGLEPDTEFWLAGQDPQGGWRWVKVRTRASDTARFSVTDREDVPLEIEIPVDQVADAARVVKGDETVFSIDGDGVLHLAGVDSGGLELAFKPAANDRLRFVTVEGNDANDGLSWGSAKATIQAALDELDGPGTVHVGGGTFAPFRIENNGTSVIGVSQVAQYAPATQISSINDDDILCDLAAGGDCLIRGLDFTSTSPTFTGIAIKCRGFYNRVYDCRIAHTGVVRDHYGADDIYGGTGIDIENSEGNRFSHITFFYCHICIRIGLEGTENVFEMMRGGNSRQALVCDGAGGGNLFIHWKLVSDGDPTDPTTPVVDIGPNSGDNTFIHSDFDEAGENRVYIRSDNNVFLHSSLSPACHMFVEGDNNYFLKFHSVGGPITVSGAGNEFTRLSTLGPGITSTDETNIIDPQNKGTVVSGPHRRRQLVGVPRPATALSAVQRAAPVYTPDGDLLGYSPMYSVISAEYEALVAGTEGIVSRWTFDEVAGVDAADDIGINEGIYANGVTLGTAPLINGSAGHSATFDGVDDSVTVAHHASQDITDALTIEAWVKPVSKGAGTEHTILLKNDSYYLRIIEGADAAHHGLQFNVWIGGALIDVTAPLGLVAFGVKNHIVGVFNGVDLKLYLNGELIATRPWAGAIDVSANGITLMSGIAPAKGAADEFALYNVAMIPQTIRDHYNVGA